MIPRTVLDSLAGLVIRIGPAVCLWLALAAGAATAEPQATASEVVIERAGGTTTFRLTLDKPVEFNVFALEDPYRVILDLPEIEFDLPSGVGTQGQGVVKAFRYGIFQPGRSRIVIDMTGPVSIDSPEVVANSDGSPPQLRIAFAGITRAAFLRGYALNGQAAREAAPVVTRTAAAPAGSRRDDGRQLIVIDPGHGGVDPGAIGRTGTREKDVVLAFARTLRDQLLATGHFEVLMTRDQDTFMRLSDRREFARSHGADLFVSIHADSIRSAGIRGATVYTVSERASDQEAAALAAQENKADLIAGMQLEEFSEEVSGILVDLARRDTKNRSVDFAGSLVERLKASIQMNGNPQRHAGFVVLKAHDVPSVLVELGYLSNSSDEERLSSGDWQVKAADAFVGAANRFFRGQVAGKP